MSLKMFEIAIPRVIISTLPPSSVARPPNPKHALQSLNLLLCLCRANKSVFKDEENELEDNPKETNKEQSENIDEKETTHQICPCPFGKERSYLLYPKKNI